jgi:hypothetical protein
MAGCARTSATGLERKCRPIRQHSAKSSRRRGNLSPPDNGHWRRKLWLGVRQRTASHGIDAWSGRCRVLQLEESSVPGQGALRHCLAESNCLSQNRFFASVLIRVLSGKEARFWAHEERLHGDTMINTERVRIPVLLILLPLYACGGLLLAGCGGGNTTQGAAPAPTTPSAPAPPLLVPPESGDAWQERYVGTVTIGSVPYFADAMLTADGLIRLYLGGGPATDIAGIPQAAPASSAQLVGTLQQQTKQISGDGLVFGQQCEAADPIRFCAEPGHASISIAVSSVDSLKVIQGDILVTTSAGTETWSLNLRAFSNYYLDLPATMEDIAGNYQEEVADFAPGGDTIISIDAEGVLSFQSASSGCTGHGQLRPHLNGAVYVYDVVLTISGCNGQYSYLNSTFAGLATDSPSDVWDYDSNLRMWLSQQDPDVSGASPPALTTWAPWVAQN